MIRSEEKRKKNFINWMKFGSKKKKIERWEEKSENSFEKSKKSICSMRFLEYL